MRKSLVALACLSAMACGATAAEVELYGTFDTYIAVNHQGGDVDTSMRSGGASASFWGIKGSEELTPDMQVMFKLESAILVDQGTYSDAAGENGIFSRESWVGLHHNKYGMLSFGRQYTPHFLTFAMTDPTDLSLGSSHSPYFFPCSTGVNGEANDSLVRHNNSVLYVSPVMAGFTVFAYAALGEETNNDGTPSSDSCRIVCRPIFFHSLFRSRPTIRSPPLTWDPNTTSPIRWPSNSIAITGSVRLSRVRTCALQPEDVVS